MRLTLWLVLITFWQKVRLTSLTSLASSVNSTDANFSAYLLYNGQLSQDFLIRDSLGKTLTIKNIETINKLRFIQEYIKIVLCAINKTTNPTQAAVLKDIYLSMQNIALGYFAQIDTVINTWLSNTAPIRSDFINILRFMNTKLTTTTTNIVDDTTFGRIIFFNNDFNLDILNHVRAESVVNNYLGFVGNSLTAARALLKAADKNLNKQNPTQALLSAKMNEFLVKYSDANFTIFSNQLKAAVKENNVAFIDNCLFGSRNYAFVMMYEFVLLSEAYVATGL